MGGAAFNGLARVRELVRTPRRRLERLRAGA